MTYLPVNPSLNSEQLFAATSSISTPLRIIAGAGTGKTTTLVERVHYLLSQGVPASDILAISFTRLSRRDLAKRLPDGVKARTFHSFGSSILSQHDPDNHPSYLTDKERDDLIEKYCYTDPDGNLPRKDEYSFRQFQRSLSLYFQSASFDQLSSVLDVQDLPSPPSYHDPVDLQIAYRHMRYSRYYFHCVRNNTFCWDTLQFHAAALLNSGDYSGTLPTHLLVDEFQDVNPVQYSICKDTVPVNLTIVGDAKQCIYRWRGSDPSIFSNVSDDYPQLQTLPLTTNYRSTPQIIDVANYVASNINSDPSLQATKSSAGKPLFTLHSTSDVELQRVSLDAIKSFESGNSTAILCRTNRLLKFVHKALMKNGHVPLTHKGDFFTFPRPSAMISLLNLLVSKNDVYFRSLFKSYYKFPDLGSKTLAFLEALAKHHDLSLWDTLHGYAKAELTHAMSDIEAAIPRKDYLVKLGTLSENLLFAESHLQQFVDGKLETYDRKVVNFSTFLGHPRLHKSDEEQPITDDNPARDVLHEQLVLSYIPHHSSVEDFLTDAYHHYESQTPKPAVNLLTVHTAKGLEFDTVYVPQMTCSSFPLAFSHPYDKNLDNAYYSRQESDHYDEEICCLYVAVTRARLNLYLSGYYQGPSRGYKPPAKGYGDSTLTDFFRRKTPSAQTLNPIAFLETDLLIVDPQAAELMTESPYV